VPRCQGCHGAKGAKVPRCHGAKGAKVLLQDFTAEFVRRTRAVT
jgi:hypothetical protein